MTLDLIASTTAILAFAAAMARSAVDDVLTMTVSDRLCLLLLLLFPILAPMSGWPLDKIGFSMAVAVIIFFTCVALFAFGWIGGGDGKLATVTVLWVGADQAYHFLLYSAMLGGLCAVLLLAFRRSSLPTAWREKAWIARLHATDTGVPYAVAISLAGVFVLPDTMWANAFL